MSLPKFEASVRALESLRADDALEMPDPALEAQLRAAHASPRAGRRPYLHGQSFAVRAAATIVLFLGLGGLVWGAGTGILALKRWWFSIEVNGETVEGMLDGDGTREVNFTTDDGYDVSVQVGRKTLPGAIQETSITVREEGHGQLEQEVDVQRVSEAPEPERQLLTELNLARVLHTWVSPAGTNQSLWLDRDPRGKGSRLWLQDLDADGGAPLTLVLRTAETIQAGGKVSITLTEAGDLEMLLADGRGWEMAVTLTTAQMNAAHPPQELETPSGRVRVKVGD